MNSTLFNGYSGIKTHQFGLDSVSNNIANINTTGYRANNPEFKSLFSNALNSVNPNSPVSSDMNYGSTVASNSISNNDGNYKESDEEFSIAYAGKGWFVVGDNENNSFNATDVSNGLYFTRDGSFSRDAQGYVVNSAGYYMLGVDLGKIKDGVFISDTSNDEANLATGEIKPIQIPQNLHYGPTQSTNVNLALNLNSNQGEINTYKLFLDSNGKINEEKLLNQDINSLIIDNENINASAYNNAVIKITKNNETKEYNFNYGDFRTIGELKQLIKEQSGLDLDFARDINGDINKNLILELKSPALDELEVSLEGKLFDKLGLKGDKKLFNLNIQNFNTSKNYNVNDLVKLNGAVFKRVESAGNSSPLDDSNFWQMVDSSSVREWNEDGNYNINDLVKFDNKIYQKLSEVNSAPTSADWKLIDDNKTLEITQFNSSENYPKNSFVYFNNRIYQKISDETSISPDDTLNWKIVDGEKFLSDKINIANYKTTIDVFDDKGDKMVIISEFVLNNNSPTNQIWNVKSGIYDKNGENLIGDLVEHTISFDGNGKVNAEPVELKYGDKSIQYNIAGSNSKSSSNFSYIDSSLLDSSKDGTQKGELVNVGIDNNGVINLSFSNGITEKMGRVGIVAFVNDKGLQKIGGNLFEMASISVDGEDTTPASGKPILGWDESGNLRFGQVLYKYLETSNVNPADAMTDLIVFQRGYSMNAKAFTTGDDLIKEAINLKR
ncbi:flagellar hook-basal body complex protein [Helicobacter sp. MIT 14-3879]|uniref:flagellar hook-basal body complex protein n=1 Tax=Helicobacter sp. MIT 14-3879 TaxID=2040649 RepID=UPI000E1F8F5B|nr:flagellar hook-basal body complex protein [Helicobacter sp. MIT 14-3879]RDU65596.1 flagellar biosynthesis protein FlgE [Helicobacter sp. MIT 14-3879]